MYTLNSVFKMFPLVKPFTTKKISTIKTKKTTSTSFESLFSESLQEGCLAFSKEMRSSINKNNQL